MPQIASHDAAEGSWRDRSLGNESVQPTPRQELRGFQRLCVQLRKLRQQVSRRGWKLEIVHYSQDRQPGVMRVGCCDGPRINHRDLLDGLPTQLELARDRVRDKSPH